MIAPQAGRLWRAHHMAVHGQHILVGDQLGRGVEDAAI